MEKIKIEGLKSKVMKDGTQYDLDVYGIKHSERGIVRIFVIKKGKIPKSKDAVKLTEIPSEFKLKNTKIGAGVVFEKIKTPEEQKKFDEKKKHRLEVKKIRKENKKMNSKKVKDKIKKIKNEYKKYINVDKSNKNFDKIIRLEKAIKDNKKRIKILKDKVVNLAPEIINMRKRKLEERFNQLTKKNLVEIVKPKNVAKSNDVPKK